MDGVMMPAHGVMMPGACHAIDIDGVSAVPVSRQRLSGAMRHV